MHNLHPNERGPRRLFGKLYVWERVNGVLRLVRYAEVGS